MTAPKHASAGANPTRGGLVDLARQASGDYIQASGSGGPALEITILAKSDLIGGGVPS